MAKEKKKKERKTHLLFPFKKKNVFFFQGAGLDLIDLGAGTQSLLAQLDELNGFEPGGGGGIARGGGVVNLGEDLFVVAANDASAFGGASMSRGGGGGGRGTAAAARLLDTAASARFRGFGYDADGGGGGELPLGGGGEEMEGQQGGGVGGAGAAAAGDELAAVPEQLLHELDYGQQEGMDGGFGFGGAGGDFEQGQQQQQHLEEEEVVGGARLAPGSAQPSSLALPRVARPAAIDAEAAGLMPSLVIRSWIQDASPTIVAGGRGGTKAVEETLLPSAAPKKKKQKTTTTTAATAAAMAAAATRKETCLVRVDELRRRLAPRGPFSDASVGSWPEALQAMLLSRMSVPGVAEEPSAAAARRARKRARDGAGDGTSPQGPAAVNAAAAAAAPVDAFAEANAGGENVHDFGFGAFGAGGGGEMQGEEFGGGDGFGGGWRLSPADALVAANAGGEFGTNYGDEEGGLGVRGGYGPADDGIERMRAALLASAGGGATTTALGRSPGSAGLAAATGGNKATSSGERPSSDADGTRSGDENANNEVNNNGRRGALGALDEEWARTQFPAGGGSLLEETQEGKEARRHGLLATATQQPRVEELPAATRVIVQAMRARFSSLVQAGRAPRLSLDEAATGLSSNGSPLCRLDAARLFYQVCACVSAGYVKAAQRAPYGDVLLAPGRAMGNLEAGGGGVGGGVGGGRRANAAALARAVSARA